MGPVLTGPTTLQTGPDPVLGPGVAGVIGDEPLLPYRDHRDDQGTRQSTDDRGRGFAGRGGEGAQEQGPEMRATGDNHGEDSL